MSVLFTQLIVRGGLTALSVQGARNARALAGRPLELVERNGAKVLRVVGDEPSVPTTVADPPSTVRPEIDPRPPQGAGHAQTSARPASADAEHWLAELELRLS